MKALHPLGDQGVLLYFADETAALDFAAAVRGANGHGLVDVVSSYDSVAVFFDLRITCYAAVVDQLRRLEHALSPSERTERPLRAIPCCYELALDLDRIAENTGLSADEAIALHLGQEYVVYAIGFCPGFPYLGYLDERLRNVPRLASPRLRVEAGSIGLTGRQTGIYTEARPGGWNIIGRTPLTLVDVEANYFPLHAGDRVRFRRIDRTEFARLQGQRL